MFTDYKPTFVQVFFKAGVLARLEDLRDEKLAVIMTALQTKIRWYLAQKDVKRRIQQRAGLLIIQRNIRSWCTLRTWDWFKLYGKVKPLLKTGKEQEELDALQKRIQELEEALKKEEGNRKELETQHAKLVEEKNALFLSLEKEKAALNESEERANKLQSVKNDLDRQCNVSPLTENKQYME